MADVAKTGRPPRPAPALRALATWSRALGARLFGLLRFTALLMLASPVIASAQDDPGVVLERRVKAALLYRFVNYVDWQEAVQKASAPFTIAIAGADGVASELAEFASGRTVLNRPLAVRKVRAADIPRDAQVVFIGKGEASQLAAVIRSIPPNVLIVTESDDGLQHGSVINFIIVEGQVRIEISLDAARRRNFHVCSRLSTSAESCTKLGFTMSSCVTWKSQRKANTRSPLNFSIASSFKCAMAQSFLTSLARGPTAPPCCTADRSISIKSPAPR